MQWLSAILVSLTVWFATCSYYQKQIANLQKEHAIELQVQAQTNAQKFYEDFTKEKERYEALNKELAQARRDVADITSANDRMRNQLSTLSRLQSNKDRETCLRELDECRAVAVELSDLAGEAYEAFELQKRADQITGKMIK